MLDCSDNKRIAFDYFVQKGLSDDHAAAIIGNLQQESNLDPRAFNAGEGANGIAQWEGVRWQNALAYAQETRRDVWSLGLQLDFVWRELPSNGLGVFLASRTLEEATVAFQDHFERCGTCNTSARIAFARRALLSCPRITPPLARRRPSIVLVTGATLVLVAVAGGIAHTEWQAMRRGQGTGG